MNIINDKTQLNLEFNEANFERLKKDCVNFMKQSEKLHKEIGDKNRTIYALESQLFEKEQLIERLKSELTQINKNIVNLLNVFCKAGTVHFEDGTKH